MVEEVGVVENQQQIPVGSDEVYANYIQEERIRNVISQTSPDNQLAEIEWRLKGYKKNPITHGWEKIDESMEDTPPQLISRYISFLSSFLNDNIRFSNLSGSEINSIMARVIEWITDDLDAHAEEYKLQDDYTERSRIGYILINETFAVLKRSQNGMESKRVWNSLSLSEASMNTPKQSGIKEALKFWKR